MTDANSKEDTEGPAKGATESIAELARRARILSIDEWVVIMNRMFEVLSGQLWQLENLCKRYGRVHGGATFSPQDARCLSSLASTIKNVRVTTDGIEKRRLSEEQRLQVQAVSAKHAELERRLARLAVDGEGT